jgi:hypothetical protein
MKVADTSLEAYQRTNADLWREKVLTWLVERGGEGTLWQACADLGKAKNALSGRFTELSKAGLIRDSGKRMKDPSTVASARVWELVPTKPKQMSLF